MWVRVTLLLGLVCAQLSARPPSPFVVSNGGGSFPQSVTEFTPRVSTDRQSAADNMVLSAGEAFDTAIKNQKQLQLADAKITELRTKYTQLYNEAVAAKNSKDATIYEAALKQLQTDKTNLDKEVSENDKDIQKARNMMAEGLRNGGRVANCPGCGGGGAGGGGGMSTGEALLMAGLIGGGAAAAAAAMAGGGKDKKPATTPNPNEELLRSQAAAEKANQERLALEGQIVTLGQRVNEDMARDARGFSAIALTVTPNQATMAPPNSLGLTYGLSEQEAMGGPATRCYNATGQLVPCTFIPTNSSSRGVVALGTRANEADRPIRCFDANNRSVACPTPRTAQAAN